MVDIQPIYQEFFKIYWKPKENGKKRTFYKNWAYNPDYDEHRLRELMYQANDLLPDLGIDMDFGEMIHQGENCDYNQYDENRVLQLAPKRSKKKKDKKKKQEPKKEKNQE